MKFLIFLVSLGGAFAILHTFLSYTAASLLAWPVGFGFYLIGIRLWYLLLWHFRYKRVHESVDPETQAAIDSAMGIPPDRR